MRITRAPQFRAGYSFTEVMFAVVVLGIGFIMIAAMFPVAIQQSQLTSEETTAAGVAREAVKQITSIADRNTMRPTDGGANTNLPPVARFVGVYTPPPNPVPPAPTVVPINPANTGSWDAVRGNLIVPADSRYAYVPLYSRATGSQYAKLNVVVVRVRERSTYDATDIATTTSNLVPRVVTAAIQNNVGGTTTDWVTLTGAATQAIGEGAYVIIASHTASGPTPINHYAGRAFRIGNRAEPIADPGGGTITPAADTWELSPSNDFSPDLTATGALMPLPASLPAYVIGREEDPSAAGTYRGIAQDVSFYTTYIQVKP